MAHDILNIELLSMSARDAHDPQGIPSATLCIAVMLMQRLKLFTNIAMACHVRFFLSRHLVTLQHLWFGQSHKPKTGSCIA